VSYREKDIVHENGGYWVLRKGVGHFEVYRIGVCASTKCATIHFRDRPDYARDRAIAECDRREEQRKEAIADRQVDWEAVQTAADLLAEKST
jgi:hypothetical protein